MSNYHPVMARVEDDRDDMPELEVQLPPGLYSEREEWAIRIEFARIVAECLNANLSTIGVRHRLKAARERVQ